MTSKPSFSICMIVCVYAFINLPLKVPIFIFPRWLRVYRASSVFLPPAGRNPQSWQRFVAALLSSNSSPTILTSVSSSHLCVSGPRQDRSLDINHSHASCQTGQRHRNGRRETQRTETHMWVLNNGCVTWHHWNRRRYALRDCGILATIWYWLYKVCTNSHLTAGHIQTERERKRVSGRD